jgi:hypothetical protein
MFCGRTGHLDEFFFHHKRIEKRCFNYARNSYHDEFSDFPPYPYSRASPRTSSRALSHLSHGSNHHSYSFGPQENNLVAKCFGYDPRPHRGDNFLRSPSFPARGSHTHLEPRNMDGPCFPHSGSRSTGSNGEVQRTAKTFSGRMVKFWIPALDSVWGSCDDKTTGMFSEAAMAKTWDVIPGFYDKTEYSSYA